MNPLSTAGLRNRVAPVSSLNTSIVDLNPDSREQRDHLASAYNALAQNQAATGQLAQAAATYRLGIAIREQLVSEQAYESREAAPFAGAASNMLRYM